MDTLSSIEGVIDSPFNDTLRGDDRFNIFVGRVATTTSTAAAAAIALIMATRPRA